MNGWDWALIIVVAVMGTAVAYLRNPEHKAYMLMLPFPFTIATMAVGRPVNAANVFGFWTLFGFTFFVWLLRTRWHWHILLAIGVSLIAYCLTGIAMTHLNTSNEALFWWSLLISFAVGWLVVWKLPHRQEPHHRTPLPLWIKFPAIMLVIYLLVLVKRQLGAFVTSFPMVGLVAAYESRFSLWTNVRRIPWIIIIITPMLACIHLLQGSLGELKALGVSWLVFLVCQWIWHTQYIKRQDDVEEDSDDDDAKPAVVPVVE